MATFLSGKTGKLWVGLWKSCVNDGLGGVRKEGGEGATRIFGEGRRSANGSAKFSSVVRPHAIPPAGPRARLFTASTAPSPVIAQYATRRSFTSGGILLYGIQPASKNNHGAPAVVESSIAAAKSIRQTKKSILSSQLWKRAITNNHGSCPDCSRRIQIQQETSSGPLTSIRAESTKPPPLDPDGSARQPTQPASGQPHIDKPPSSHTKPVDPPPVLPSTNPPPGETPHSYFHLPDLHLPEMHLPKLPQLPHRPTKQELLEAATGFWSRLKVRFKWLTIRSVRPWNVDDWSAFVSWFVLGHIVWILLGTTTFVSLLIFLINTVAAQETLARWVGDYLTQSTGVKVVFENAVVPKWRDGVISFRNVFVSRRAGNQKAKVSKGSSMEAAATAAAQRQAQHQNQHGGLTAAVSAEIAQPEDDGNYTQFDVTIDTVNVTLSFAKWWNGKGLLKDVEIKGIRGVVDRTNVVWPDEYVDPRTYKHKHTIGDFEIENFKMEDLLLTIHQPNNFRPYSVSVFTAELPQLRKQWLFYDFLSANQMGGSFDGSLFNIHPHQSHSPVHHHPNGTPLSAVGGQETDFDNPQLWKKHSRMRIDGLKIDHLNKGVEGLFGWIYEGNVDIVADIVFPTDTDESIGALVSDLYDRLEASVTNSRYRHLLENQPHVDDLRGHEAQAKFDKQMQEARDSRFLVMDMRVALNSVRASVPLYTSDLSYINQALIRPIVAYINSRKTFIPIQCRIVKKVGEFDGSWTIHDCGLMEDLSAEIYEAFARDVSSREQRLKRFKKVGIWSMSLALQAIFMTMSGSVA